MHCINRLAAILLILAFGTSSATTAEDTFISFSGEHHLSGVDSFAPLNEREVLCVCRDKVIRQINIDAKSVVKDFRFQRGVGQRGKLTALAVSPDRKRFAVGTFGEPGVAPAKIYIVDILKHRIVRSLDGHQKTVRALRFIDGGKKLLSTSEDRTVCVWDSQSGARLKQIELPEQGHLLQVIDADRIVVSLVTGHISLINLNAAQVTRTVVAHDSSLRGLLYVGDRVISGGPDGKVVAWSADLTAVQSITFKEGQTALPLTGMTVTKDRQHIAYSLGLHDEITDLAGSATARTNKAGILNAKTLQKVRSLSGQKLPVRNVVQTSNSDFIGLNEESDIVAWNQNGEFAGRLYGLSSEYLYSARFSHGSQDQSLIVWASEYGTDRAKDVYKNSFSLSLLNREALRPTTLPPETYPVNKTIKTASEATRNRVWQSMGNSIQVGVPDYVAVFLGDQLTSKFFLQPFSKFGRNRRSVFLDQQRALFATSKGLFVLDSNHGQLIKELFDQSGFVTNVSFPRGNANWFMTNASDNVLRFWNRHTQELVFSLFITGNEWVIWTKDGHYDCSAGGERIVGWHVNRGHDRLADFQPLQNFHKNFHSPEIIRRLWQSANVDAAFSGAKKPKFRAQDNLGPDIQLTMDSGTEKEGYVQVRSSEIELDVNAVAQSGSVLTNVDLLINGRYVKTVRRYETRKVRDSFKVKFNLSPGLQDIEVLAKASNQTHNVSDSTRVFYKSSSVKSPSRKLFVLGIGISDYANSNSFPRLPKAAKQSGDVVQILKDGGRGLFDEGVEAVSLNPKTRDEVFDAIIAIKKDFQPTDMLVLYWAGHGIEVRRQFFFAMPGAEKDTIRQKGISAEDLSSTLAELGGGKIFLLLDTCEAGAALETLRDRVRANGRADEYGIMTIAAAPRYQEAKDGLFGDVLIEGLTGTEDTVYREPPLRKAIVMSQKLESFLHEEVRQRSQKAQEPISNGFSNNRNYRITFARSAN